MSKDLCQADRSDEKDAPALYPFCGSTQAYYSAEMAWMGYLRAAFTQSPIEERSDTATAEQREAGLTQKIPNPPESRWVTPPGGYPERRTPMTNEEWAREIVERSMNQPVELVTAISSALSTAYEEGQAAGYARGHGDGSFNRKFGDTNA
jgi:hypothetical protein